MCFATLLPLGILQLYKSVNEGYFEARELKFLTNDTNTVIEWLRLPGDIVFIAGGAIPVLYIAYLGIRHTVKRVTLEEPEDILFTEIAEPAGGPRRPPTRPPRAKADVSARGAARRGYAALLLRGRRALEWLSAHTHRRSLRYRTAGFTYDPEHDHWQCPEGEHLWPHEFDHERRLVRYRAKAHICNGCPRKERLHRLRPRARDRAAAGPVAALRGRALPPRPVADARGAGAARARGGRRPQPRARRGGAAGGRRCVAALRHGPLAAARLPRHPAELSGRPRPRLAADGAARRPRPQAAGRPEPDRRTTGDRRRSFSLVVLRWGCACCSASGSCASTSARSSSGSAGCCPCKGPGLVMLMPAGRPDGPRRPAHGHPHRSRRRR